MEKIITSMFPSPYIFSVRLPKKGETFLWDVSDNDFTYHHFFQFGYVTDSRENGPLKFGIQLIIGPLMLSLAFPK